ncbi:hypothetical protein Y695_04852 [Hydrogenophaga sp. T4]|nr:hypothetical protein Y695_04852 [Hydrogenophaga sp. T4]
MARAEESSSFRPMSASEGYLPGRSTTQRPWKLLCSQTSQRLPTITTDEVRSLKL